jgi:hypothetical protein
MSVTRIFIGEPRVISFVTLSRLIEYAYGEASILVSQRPGIPGMSVYS